MGAQKAHSIHQIGELSSTATPSSARAADLFSVSLAWHSAQAEAIVKTVIALGHNFIGLEMIAEGVEKASQARSFVCVAS